MNDVVEFAMVMAVILTSTAAFVAIVLGAIMFWRRGSVVKPQRDAQYDGARQQRLETAVDAIAIEVERISEAQRFMVGLLSQPLSAPRAELAPAERAGRVITPH